MKKRITISQSQIIRTEVKNIHGITHAILFFILNNQSVKEPEKYLVHELQQTLLQHEINLFNVLHSLQIID